MKVLLTTSWKTSQPHPPLGIGYIASVLRENNIDVEILEYGVIKDDVELNQKILKSDPDVVGISAMSHSFPTAQKIAKVVKENLKDVKVILGGPHPTVMPLHVLSDNNIDIVVIGEGERTALELVNSLNNGQNLDGVNGIYYRTPSGEIKKTAPRTMIENLDELPFPARDLMPMELYLSNIPVFPVLFPDVDLIAVRGCPFNCTYCQPTGDAIFGKKIRYRSQDNIIDEIELLKKEYKATSIAIGGDTFTANQKWVFDFCRKLKERNIEMMWTASTRVNAVTKELLKTMKDAGCYFITFGVESGSQRILDEIMHKAIKVDHVKSAFNWCNEVGIITMANFMIGSPTETKEDVEKSLSLIKEMKPDAIGIYVTNPLPGTYLFDFAKEKNLLLTDDLSKFSRHAAGTMKRELTDEEVDNYVKLFASTIKKLQHNYILNPKKSHFLKIVFKRNMILLRRNPSKGVKEISKSIRFLFGG